VIKLKDILMEDIIEADNVLDTLTEALPHLKKLGNKPMLTRESGGIIMGAAKVTSGPWDKGRIGSAINPKSPVYKAYLQKNITQFPNWKILPGSIVTKLRKIS